MNDDDRKKNTRCGKMQPILPFIAKQVAFFRTTQHITLQSNRE
jgi:hypothetical protein